MFRYGDSVPKPTAAPLFPLFLLPTLKIPFRRPRQSSTATTAPNNPPSLSSSPSSSIDDHNPPSPTSGEAYSLDPPPPKAANRDRLARTAPDVLRCNTCATDVAFGAQIVSKGFTGRHGRAYLVEAPSALATPSCPGSPISACGTGPRDPNSHSSIAQDGNLVNIRVGRRENRQLVTGAHLVADIHCTTCGTKLGWKYVDAREQSQKYKVGKFILETQRVVAYQSWEDVLGGSPPRAQHFYSSSLAGGARVKDRGAKKMSESSEADGSRLEEEREKESESEGEVSFDSDDEDECEDIFAGIWDAETVARRRSCMVGGSGRRKKKQITAG